jgi:hypothetical protein
MKHEISLLFLFLLMIYALLDPDPDPATKHNADSDPKTVFFNKISSIL